MKTTSESRKGLMILSGILFLELTLQGCTKDDDATPASTDNLLKSEENLNYTFPDNPATCTSCIDSMPYETLSQAETNALLLMREEEFLAHDVYTSLSALYTKPVFRQHRRQ
jgi:hypothetical protein